MSSPAVTQYVARVRLADGGTHFAAPETSGRYQLLEGTPFTGLSPTGRSVEADALCLLPPVAPTKIIGIGANYPGDEAAIDRRFPSMFLMPASALLAAGEAIVLPWLFDSVLAEGELAVVIARRASRLRAEDVERYILGYTIANDLSGRGNVLATVPAAVKKGSDGLLPLGPHLLLCSEVRHFTIATKVNDRMMQHGNSSDMIFGVRECLVHITSVMTLEAGDVVSLGTPPPKPRLIAGDRVSVTIEGIGTLENVVRAA